MYSSTDLVDLYDLEHAGFDRDLHLYQSYLLLTGGPALDLGCGTGRVMRPLVEGGYHVTGIDSSAAMLARARERLRDLPAGLWELVEADVTDLSALPSERFGLAYSALNTWSHIVDDNAALAALGNVHRVLRPAGLLILDLEDPEGRLPGRGELVLAGVFRMAGDVVTKMVSSSYDPLERVERVTAIWDRVAEGKVSRAMSSTRLRSYSRSELRHLLARAGFVIEDELGSWDLDPYAASGDRLIVVGARS